MVADEEGEEEANSPLSTRSPHRAQTYDPEIMT